MKHLEDNFIIDSKLSKSIVFSLIMLLTNHTFKEIFGISNPQQRQLVSIVFFSLVGLVFLLNIRYVLKRSLLVLILIYLSSIAIFLLGIMLNFEMIDYSYEVMFYYFLLCLPLFLFLISIENKFVFFNHLKKTSYLQFFIGALYFYAVDKNVLQYDMIYSYLMLLPMLLILNKLFDKFKLHDLLIFIFGLVIILSVGSRGPLISILVYYFLKSMYFIPFKSRNYYNLFLFRIPLIIAPFLMFFFFNDLISTVINIFNFLGLNSRTLIIFSQINSIDFLTGRNLIFLESLQYINASPLVGHGLLADRILLNGTYPHNLFLEVFIHFGIPTGVILFLIIIYKFVKSLIHQKSYIRELSILFFSLGFVSLLFTGSYLTNYRFWIFLGIIFTASKGNNKL